ncbi:MAG: 2Fe-2S iron-sulfur cluster-binding protein [Solirubrobacteraceae bacterium]
MTRLAPQPGERIDRRQRLRFSFDGETVEGLEGDTIASALFAGGRRVFSRSFKYHRPRGLLCCSGACANCLVAVDGRPGVRACTEPARAGIRVEHLNAWPSLQRDALRAVDRFGGAFTPPGFYYKTMIRPRRLWPVFEWGLRRIAGLGRLAKQDERRWRTSYRRRHADVLIIGGGLAGLSAAIAAAQAGADVVLVDDGPRAGGRLLHEGGHERAAELAGAARGLGVEVLTEASALGYYDGLVAVWQGSVLHQIRARAHVAATGTIDQPLVFAGNDLPGVMTSDGARRLAALYAVRPGSRAVVATTGDRGLQAALALREAGVQLALVTDERAGSAAIPIAAELAELGVEVLAGATIIRADGDDRVERATIARIAADGRREPGSERTVDCDLVVVSGGSLPATSLLAQAGAAMAFEPASGQFLPGEMPAHVQSAGEIAGLHDDDAIELSGAIAGTSAAHAAGDGGDDGARARLADERAELERLRDGPGTSAVAPASCGATDQEGKAFVCLCEDVTDKDIAYAAAEGYDSIELSKRYTTVTMGPCQGRMCQLASIRAVGRHTNVDAQAVGQTTARPPWTPVPMGVLAGRPFEPAKRSSIHARHRALGANVMWAGDWRRPYDYGDPAREVRAVHDAAGIIDLSSLGKLLVQGPQAGELLDRLYPNRLSNLKVGRLRYGVLGSDAGRIKDDGTIFRLDERGFYVTTTSSGAGAVEEWFAWWLADWRLDAHITDVTQTLAAVNLAGPRARAILQRLTDLDCSPDAFGYLDGRRAHVAGIPALVLRIGFVGELGYEIHAPAAHGQALWDAIVAAGAEDGIEPFGMEPQRVLRLQKAHVIVGQDTDGESNPYSASMPWIVKLDKEGDFVGRWALEHAAEREQPQTLVGFRMPAGAGAPPHEGAAVVVDGASAGRVTSARHSERLGHAIGLAWVPAALSHAGARIEIADEGRSLSAEVVRGPFYDPDNERQRA